MGGCEWSGYGEGLGRDKIRGKGEINPFHGIGEESRIGKSTSSILHFKKKFNIYLSRIFLRLIDEESIVYPFLVSKRGKSFHSSQNLESHCQRHEMHAYIFIVIYRAISIPISNSSKD